VHLVGFITRICHDALSHERKKKIRANCSQSQLLKKRQNIKNFKEFLKAVDFALF
jgi:hypothetical protein